MYAGLGILIMMNFISLDVSTICVGMAAHGRRSSRRWCKGKTFGTSKPMVLIHQPSSGVQGQQTDIQIVADETVDSPAP